MVYVVNQHGQPLMPTNRHGKVRHLLNTGRAKVIKKCPFTIQLLYESTSHTQKITLGVDAGSKHIGLSATTKDKELYASDVELRTDIVDLLATRKECRRTRRNRLRYRKPRFDNRVRNEKWLAPSIEQKIQCHLKAVEDVHKLLPITNIIIETASFDIQKIKNPSITGTEYQEGDLLDFWNVREYVFWRDNHVCQHCKGKSKDKILNVHHIESRKTGGNAPNNLITLCETCHKAYHEGRIELKINRGRSYKDAAFMGIMRWACYERLKERYQHVSMTYGYLTKNTRIINGFPKEHYVDARCISGNPQAEPLGHYFYSKKVRCHNRQIHKMNIIKGGKKRANQAPYLVRGFRLFDKVRYKKQECFIFGRRLSGRFNIRKLDKTVIHTDANYKHLKLVEPRRSYITERRKQERNIDIPLTTLEVGVPC